MSLASRNEDWLAQQLNAFAAAWQQGMPPEIADFLPPLAGTDDATSRRAKCRQLLQALILVDLEFRWHRPLDPATTIAYQPGSVPSTGALPNRPRLEDYARRYPEVGPLAEIPDELIVCEFRLRKLWGDKPVVDVYRTQFGPRHEALWATLEEISAEGETNRDISLRDTQRALAQRALKVRCPHCHHPVEILDHQAITEITCPSCDTVFSLVGRAASPSGTAAPPLRFGHFELLHQVGEGGFGAVWKAHDMQLDRIVAVKIPRRTQLDAQDTEQFIREARAAAQLKHPNIVSVHEVGREQETVYIVSDFIEGQSLDKWLAIQPQTPQEAAVLCRKIAIALHHAHEAGVVHRDLKPSNIVIDPVGEPHVMDFGLAKREAGEITMTVEGRILGTPAYMSPEQARGEGHKADRRSDVYSLGVILFELLTGERPFRGDLRMLLKQVIDDEPPSPRKLDGRISRDLETITLKCLEKDADRRYASAAELSEELTRFIEHMPIHARPISRGERAWRWCKRNPIVAGLSTAVLLVLLAGLTGVSVFAIEARRQSVQKDAALQQVVAQRDRTDEEARRAIAAAERAQTEERKANQRLYLSQIARAQQAWESGDRSTAKEHLQACRRDLRGWEYHYLDTQFSREKLMEGHTARVSSVAFSPDGKQIVSGGGESNRPGEIKVWDATNGTETLTLQGHTQGVSAVAFSPDGKRIVSGGGESNHPGEIKVWDSTSGAEILSLKGHAKGVSCVAFSPDGKWIVSGSKDKTLKIWDSTNGTKTRTLELKNTVECVAFSPDGKRFVSCAGELQVWDTTSGAEIMTFKGRAGWGKSVAFSSDGQRIVSGSQFIQVWDATSGVEILKFQGDAGLGSRVAFSPDGKLIVSGSKYLKVWDATNGAEILTLKGHAGWVSSVAFSPDGKRFVSGSEDKTVRVWDAMGSAETLTLHGHAVGVSSVSFSPDGNRILSGSYDGTLKLWDARTGEGSLTLKFEVGQVSSAAFSPDGKRVVSCAGDVMRMGENTLRVWDAIRGTEIRTFKGHVGGVISVAFSPDGKWIVSGSMDKTVKVWDAKNGTENLTLEGHTQPVGSVAFSPDGKRIVSGSGDKTLRVWDATSGAETMTLIGHTDGVTSVAFSPDGKRIVSGSADQTLKVWDATSTAEPLTMKGYTKAILSVAFSPDGKRIVSGSMDQTLRIWDATSGEETLTLKGHTGAVASVAFSPDGKRIVSGCEDKTIKIWDSVPVE